MFSGNVHAGGISWYRKFRYPSSDIYIDRVISIKHSRAHLRLQWNNVRFLPVIATYIKVNNHSHNLFMHEDVEWPLWPPL